MKLKKLFAAVLAVLMIFSNTFIASAAKGPNRYLGYIEIYNDKTDVFLFNNYTSDPVGKITGAVYDQKTNTLTLTNFNHKDLNVATNTMGDDFKIKLVGENHIQRLSVWGDAHGGSCEFTGSGKLFVNENKLSNNAMYFAPEGASSVISVSESATVTAYSADGCNSLYINGTDNANSLQCNASVKPKSENCTYTEGISVITSVDEYTDTHNVYKKQGSADMYAVKLENWTNATYVRIYQLVENPDDMGTYLLLPYSTDRFDAGYEFEPSTFQLTETDKTVEARATYYSTYEILWKDKNSNEFVFLSKMNWDTFADYFQQCSVVEFVESTDYYGNSMKWYKTTPVDGAVEYENEDAIIAAGFVKSTGIIKGLYNIYVAQSPLTLSAGKHNHSYKNVVTKATLTSNGKIVPTCSCGATKSATTIYYPKTIKLSTTSYTYDGKAKKPTVTVKDSKGNKIASSNYTVTYSNNKNAGKATVKITFKGNYSGTKTLTFKINPKGTTISSVSASSKAFTVKWKKQATQTSGYQIQYSTSSSFSNPTTVTVSKNSTTSKKVTKLKGKKKYYVRVRTYKTVSGTKYYSGWSASKSVTTKK